MSKDAINVTCPYCSQPAELVDSNVIYPYSKVNYGKFWNCMPCGAWVGVHKNSPRFAPLGRLANAELRQWKMKAHAVFDPLWKSERVTRTQAYKMMEEALGVSKADAHIGKLDVDQCKKLVDVFTEKTA